MNMQYGRSGHSYPLASGVGANYDLAVISLESEFTIVTVKAIRQHVDELLSRGCHQFVLNFEQVEYMDSSGMGLLIYLQKTLDACGGKLSMVNMSSEICVVFTMLAFLSTCLQLPFCLLLEQSEKSLSVDP